MILPELKESGVVFNAEDHTYFLGDKQLQGITSTLIHRAFPNEYTNVSPEMLAQAAQRGHDIHELIEFCEANVLDSDKEEWQMYKQHKGEQGLTLIQNEYLVTDFENFASAIDGVYVQEDGGIVLVDYKTNYTPPVDKVTVQLSWYKRVFEAMNPDLKVARCAMLWLRCDKNGSRSKWTEIVPWADEALDSLIWAELHDEPFSIEKTYGDLPVKFASVENEVAMIEQQVKALQERQKELKQGLYDLMEQNNIKSWTGSKVRLTRVLPTKKATFDSKTFKADHPKLFAKYSKESESAGSLRITVTD